MSLIEDRLRLLGYVPAGWVRAPRAVPEPDLLRESEQRAARQGVFPMPSRDEFGAPIVWMKAGQLPAPRCPDPLVFGPEGAVQENSGYSFTHACPRCDVRWAGDGPCWNCGQDA